MSWIDLGIVVVLVVTTIVGFRRGLVRQIVELMGLVGGVFLGLYFTTTIVEHSGALAQFRFTPAVVFMLLVGLSLVVANIVGRVASEIMQVTFFGWFDQVGGAAAGMLKGALWMSILISVVLHMDVSRGMSDHVRESTLAEPIAGLLPAAFEVVKAYARDVPLQEPFDSAVR